MMQATSTSTVWHDLRFEIERHIAQSLSALPAETVDPNWRRCREVMAEYTLRPAKRVRAALLLNAFALSRHQSSFVPALYTFGAGVELLHTFMLVHDDIADNATTRRGAPALHSLIGSDRAIVAGDYLFARAVELMLSSGMTHAAEATRYYLQVCRETAAGQYLDLDLGKIPLAHVSLFQTMKVAQLKTARYGFIAPMVAGAMLAGADKQALVILERIGRLIGLSYQFVDDLIGMFGDAAVAGKQTDSDYLEGKRTFPVIAAYVRANEAQRKQMDALWAEPKHATYEEARQLLIDVGGKAATERVIRSSHRAARALIMKLPNVAGHRDFLLQLLQELSVRSA